MAEKAGTKRSSTPVLMFLVFIIPVGLAFMALQFDWFNKASTNKGQLLDTPYDLNLLDVELSQQWRLLYVLPNECGQACENALYSLNQIWIATGKASDRVEAVVVGTDKSISENSELLDKHSHLRVLTSNRQNVNKVFKDDATDGIFIVDTLGNVILKYPLKQQQQDAIQQSRDILADLRKLLKLSRIG